MKRRKAKTSTARPKNLATRELFSKKIKCIWSGPVNVKNTPTGETYKFRPGDVTTITNAADYDYLLQLQRGKGVSCCGGTGKPRHYFEAL